MGAAASAGTPACGARLAPRAALPPADLQLEASQSRLSLARKVYVASLLGGWAALCVALGGLAALQASLNEVRVGAG